MKKALVYICAALLCVSSCTLSLDPKQGDGKSGTVFLEMASAKAAGRSAAPVEGPGEYAPFQYLSLTVRRGNKIVAGPVRVSPDKTPSINVPYGSDYTLEVLAPVDRNAPGVKGFAKTYGGVSGLFSVSSSNTSVPVPIQMTEPVQIEFSYDPDTGNLILFENDFFRFNLYSFPSISFDKYGRMILSARTSDSMGDGLYFFDEYPYPLSFYGVPGDSVYDPASGGVFYTEYDPFTVKTVKYVDLSTPGNEITYTYASPDSNIEGFAFDGQGKLFGYNTVEDESGSVYPQIKKYTIDHGGESLLGDPDFVFKIESPEDVYFSQAEMQYISGRLVVIVSYGAGNSEIVSHYHIYIIDPNDPNNYAKTPLFYLPGPVHVSGWDNNGINLYLFVDHPDLVTGDIPGDLYITWDAGFDAIPTKASIHAEVFPEGISAPDSYYLQMELYAYGGDNPVILKEKSEEPYYELIRKDGSAAVPVNTHIYGPIDINSGGSAGRPDPLSLDLKDIEPGKYQILVKVLNSDKNNDYYIDGRAFIALDPPPWYDSELEETLYTGFTLFRGTPYMSYLYFYAFSADTDWNDIASWYVDGY
ncbi:MAG: hypothetical protein LBF78_14785 [Treponema sp.]|jgi:hypothetical protein|nr:hypothetical protein [Treponema sp.]